jgi:hypothetical protein
VVSIWAARKPLQSRAKTKIAYLIQEKCFNYFNRKGAKGAKMKYSLRPLRLCG